MEAKERKSKEYAILLLESARQHHGVDNAPHEKVFNKSDIQAAYETGWDAAMQSVAQQQYRKQRPLSESPISKNYK